MQKHPHVLKAIQSELWAITPDALNQIIAIAQGFGDPDAVAAKLGRPLANTHDVTIRDGIATIPIIGPIFRYADIFTQISGATSIQSLATDLQAAVDDQQVKSIILEIDSPGGMIAGVSEFAAQIRTSNDIKPVTAYISDMGASAAYWIASAAGEIVASNTARVGSIGVVMQAQIGDEEGAIKFISSQSPLKQADPASDTGKAQYQKTVDNLAEVFINSVANYRSTTRENIIANYGMGGMHIASDAVKLGMIDKIGNYESLINIGNAIMKETNLTVLMTMATLLQDYPALCQELIGQGAETERARIQAIDDLSAMGHDTLVNALKYDGKTTAAEAALKILAAEKEIRKAMKTKISEDTPPPIAHAVPAEPAAPEKTLKGEAKWRDEWEHSEALQSEFAIVESYLAYCKAQENGLVRIHGVKAA